MICTGLKKCIPNCTRGGRGGGGEGEGGKEEEEEEEEEEVVVVVVVTGYQDQSRHPSRRLKSWWLANDTHRPSGSVGSLGKLCDS